MYRMEYRLEIGDMAPDFILPATSDKNVRLYDCKNKKTVVLFFFNHKNDKCLDRLSAFAQDMDRFREAGSIILPVADMTLAEGKKLVYSRSLPFAILCDENHSVTWDYRVGQCKDTGQHVCFEVITNVTDPTIFIIDTSGIIRFKNKVDPAGKTPDNQTLLKQCEESLK